MTMPSWRTTSGGNVWDIVSDRIVLAADGWVHVLASFNTASGVRHLYVDDALDSLNSETFTASATVDYSGLNDKAIGADSDTGAEKFNGDLAEFYFTNEFLDLSVASNRQKFSVGGKPVDLGSDGSTPTGTAPAIYLSGPTDDWHLNASGRGVFVETGALTTASSSPSD